jgi:hypothetical protein
LTDEILLRRGWLWDGYGFGVSQVASFIPFVQKSEKNARLFVEEWLQKDKSYDIILGVNKIFSCICGA